MGEVNILPPPDIVILYAGWNDLGKVKTLQLFSELRRDISFMKWLLPKMPFVFSEIVPRLIWHAGQFLFFKQIQKRVNRSKFMLFVNGWLLWHIDLEGFILGLYSLNMFHLSEIGLDIFKAGFKTAIEKAAFFMGGHDGLRHFMAGGVKSHSFAE